MSKKITSNRASFGPLTRPLSHDEREQMREDTKELIEILSWQRPHESEAEKEFVRLFVDNLKAHPNVSTFQTDDFGNKWLTVIGSDPKQASRLLFSCHTDSVSKIGGRQQIAWSSSEPDVLQLQKPKPGRCLGADDGAGVWIMRRMIDAGVSGTYVFHRAEEVGRLGSGHVETYEAKRLDGFEACIAFDRRGNSDLITHQMGERCASEAFSKSLADALFYASDGDLRYVSDPTGSYTDSYSYREYIPECCNLSVGYDWEHGPRETLDAAHVWRLALALISADLSGLVFERDPTRVEYDDWGYGRGYGNVTTIGKPAASKSAKDSANSFFDDIAWHEAPFGDEYDTMTRLCRQYPENAAGILVSLGIDPADFADSLTMTEQEDAARWIMQ